MSSLPNRVKLLIDGIIYREGGYVDHPSDRGGPTMFGITQSVARQEGFTGDMRDLPQSFAEAVYLRRYYEEPRFNEVAAVSVALAEELTDTGVNMGPATATRFLQRALCAMNRGGKDYADPHMDGRIGPGTLAALRGFLRLRGRDGESVLLTALNAQQAVRYIELAEMRPTQRDFVFGWLFHRVAH